MSKCIEKGVPIIIDEIDTLWKSNGGFKEKLQSWLEQIKETQKQAKEAKKRFHQWQPLTVYVKASSTNNDKIIFSLRFKGQDVAILVAKENDIYLKISKKTANANKRYFPDLKISVGEYKWRSKESCYLRKYFKHSKVDVHSPEHHIESLIINEMRKRSRKKFGGTFSGIQPVTLSGFPLQFPLPISGSSGKPKVSHKGNGHIDILARRGRGRSVRLSVWELKAPGKYNNALREGYIYSVTLLKMLRDCELGAKWYKTFGINGAIPSSLQIECVIAITEDQKGKLEKDIKNLNLPRQIGNDHIDFFAAYYNNETLEINFQRI